MTMRRNRCTRQARIGELRCQALRSRAVADSRLSHASSQLVVRRGRRIVMRLIRRPGTLFRQAVGCVAPSCAQLRR